MAFKGTPRIGVSNREAEKAILKKTDRAYAEWLAAKYRTTVYSRQEQKELRKKFESLRNEANTYVNPNAYAKILERHGATQINAVTSKDFTMYFCSLPANRAELWFSLESARLTRPVFRQFYTEKAVVLEERRKRVDSDPTGRMMEELLAMAYMAHPYGTPTIGWATDIIATTRQDMERFYRRHYVPSNITVAVAGDVNPESIKKWAETYFGSGFRSPPEDVNGLQREILTREPEQQVERRFVRKDPNQPLYVEAYHAVDRQHPDAEAMEILAEILGNGRVSRLYQALVTDQGLAQTIQVFDGFPGKKYPGLFMIYAVPQKGASLEDLTEALHAELTKTATQGVDPDELQRSKTRLRVEVIRSLKSNIGLAMKLAQAEAQMGSWQQVFTSLDAYEQVTAEAVRTVAEKYLVPENRTSSRLVLQQNRKGEK
jgi:predicted Zn-dependent peptidase